MNAYCNNAGIGLIPWGPLSAGALARPVEDTEGGTTDRAASGNKSIWKHVFSDADRAIIGKVEEIAKRKGWTMSQVALAWVNEKVASPIIGFSTVSKSFDYVEFFRELILCVE
jgi:aryl-alcohol dehydrogenase-like predicted oxidoreductase